MRVEILGFNQMWENCYLLEDEETAVLIDPGFPAPLPAETEKKLKAILFTHGHFDHVLYGQELKKRLGVPLYIHEKDAPFLTDPALSLSAGNGEAADVLLKDGDTVRIGTLSFQVIHTPGHTAGSCCFLCGDCLFTGDTLFRGSMGRTDLPTGDPEQMRASLQKLSALPDGLKVYPGHEQITDMAFEKAHNPYLKGQYL